MSPQFDGKKATLPAPAAKPAGAAGTAQLGFTSVAFSKTGVALIAGSDGTVYTYNNGAPGKSFKESHTKMVSCINVVTHPTDASKELVITGGADKLINVYFFDAAKNLTKVLGYSVTGIPRSVDFMGD